MSSILRAPGMPKFKRGDLVRSRVALSVVGTAATRNRFLFDEHNPFLIVNEPVPLDSAPVQDLPIQPGTVFEVATVLPWGSPTETARERYKLELNRYYIEVLDEKDRTITEKEFSSLNTILAEDEPLPMYAYADEPDLELIHTADNRVPGESLLEAWAGNDYFPWTIHVTFPNPEQILCYEVDSWLCDDEAADDDERGYWLALRPLYVSAAPILLLAIRPGEDLDYGKPHIDFYSERYARWSIDHDTQMISIVVQFWITIDLDRREWQFA